jgi:hypothetical protein
MPDINVSDDLDLGVAGYETQRFTRGEVLASGHGQYNTVRRVVSDALVTGQSVKEFTVVKLNSAMEVDVYTFTDYQAGVQPFGLTGTSVDEDLTGAGIPVITSGKFNPERVHYHASFDTLEKKLNAFNYPGSNIQMVEFMYQGIE